jgi:hypothetical protein
MHLGKLVLEHIVVLEEKGLKRVGPRKIQYVHYMYNRTRMTNEF